MKKLLFATALLAALLLSACGGKTNDDDFMNKPAVTPEPGMEIDPEFGVDPEPETDENAQPAPDAELSDMVDAIYKIQPVELMGMETTAIDLTDETWYGYLAGLTADNVGKVDAAVISEPMTGSQACCCASGTRPMPARSPIRWRKISACASGSAWRQIRPAWSALMISCCMSWQTVSWSMSICWRMLPQKPLMRPLMSMIPSSMRMRATCPRSCCPPRLWQTERYKKNKEPYPLRGTALVVYRRDQALAALISLMSSGTTLYRSPTMP